MSNRLTSHLCPPRRRLNLHGYLLVGDQAWRPPASFELYPDFRQTNDNTILITGGGSGIGRGLAEAFHTLGNKVIISGRRREALDETTHANPGMASATLDIQNPIAVRSFAEEIIRLHPGLNVVVNNAGIARAENLKSAPATLEDGESIVTTNILGPIRLDRTHLFDPRGVLVRGAV